MLRFTSTQLQSLRTSSTMFRSAYGCPVSSVRMASASSFYGKMIGKPSISLRSPVLSHGESLRMVSTIFRVYALDALQSRSFCCVGRWRGAASGAGASLETRGFRGGSFSTVSERVEADERSTRGRNESFFSDETVTWRSLGLSAEVSDALLRANLTQPSVVQAATIPVICSGKDVIVAAETGSGKTHTYLAPIFDKLLKMRKEAEALEELMPEKLGRARSFSLILCPNATLCHQVVDMASMLQSDRGELMLVVTAICGSQGWPLKPPDVVVATPAALKNHLFAYDPKRRRRTAFVRDACCVIFDEADMLLGGGFAREVDHLISLFRLQEKQLARHLAKVSQLGPSESSQEDIQPWTEFKIEEDDARADSSDDELDGDENPDLEEDELETSAELPSSAENVAQVKNAVNENRRNYWHLRKQYKRSKQYIFVAATLPNNGKKSPGALLKYLFPEAETISGNLLHFHNPRIKYSWVEVSLNTSVKALLEAVQQSDKDTGDQVDSTLRVMVFANSVDAVDSLARVFQKAGINSMSFHRDISVEDRAEALRAFQYDGGVLVCTDAAARGIDIPNIGHVIQAEFATSAVDFLHRVGRTGRAGQSGLVTNLFTEASLPLVDAVKNALIQEQPVEGAFSRKRSFRKKLKKYAKT